MVGPNGDYGEPIDYADLERALSASSTKQRTAGLTTVKRKIVDFGMTQDQRRLAGC